jgi:ribose 5-phosphate isomerase B
MQAKRRMKIYIGGDHAGFFLKEKLKKYSEKSGYEVEDTGPYQYNPDDDYPDFVIPLAKKVARDKNSRGIIIAGSGQGEIIAANKSKGIRAVVYYGGNENIIRLSRQHNNSNILSLGARFVNEKEAERAIDVWLKTKFDGGRHLRRLKKIEKIEK